MILFKTHLSRALPFFIVCLSIMGCGLFSIYYLDTATRQFKSEFQQQNFIELSTGDTYALVQRLNALTKSMRWICIKASRSGNVFFEKSHGSCKAGFFSREVRVKSLQGGEIEIKFILSLQGDLAVACLVFGLLQILLLFSIAWSARVSERFKMAAQEKFVEFATQVSHDIRGPLFALVSIVQNSSEIDQKGRGEIRQIANRISDIANSLLAKNRDTFGKVDQFSEALRSPAKSALESQASVELLSDRVEGLVSEKRALFLGRKNLKVSFLCETQFLGLFVEVPISEFCRILSNLIDNAADACSESGVIGLTLEKVSSYGRIVVQDNGRGIPSEILSKVIERGGTFGKKDGNGLGLSHAKSVVESWGGRFHLHSVSGQGTEIKLDIPLAEAPPWFLTDVLIEADMTVVVIDDDPYVHQAWDRLLNQDSILKNIFYLKNPTEMLSWYRDNVGLKKFLCLCDYEFHGDNQTGLDLIERLGIVSQSVLVTGLWNESVLRSRCEKIGIKILPKYLAMAGFGLKHPEKARF